MSKRMWKGCVAICFLPGRSIMGQMDMNHSESQSVCVGDSTGISLPSSVTERGGMGEGRGGNGIGTFFVRRVSFSTAPPFLFVTVFGCCPLLLCVRKLFANFYLIFDCSSSSRHNNRWG